MFVLTKLSSVIREIDKLNRQELEAGVPIGASWHNDYNDTAYIYIGGLLPELNEGDVLAIFSQFGVPVHVKLGRNKETGKSQGYGFLKYEDQRSTVLAVDNLNGAEVLGRKLRVDHTYFKPPEDLSELEAEMAFDDYLYAPEKSSRKSSRRSHRDREEKSGSRRHHDHDKRGRGSSDKSSSTHRSSRRRDRSKSPRPSSLSQAHKTEDDLEKELEDPMASYFKEKERQK